MERKVALITEGSRGIGRVLCAREAVLRMGAARGGAIVWLMSGGSRDTTGSPIDISGGNP
ncbi:hypothetical protein GCM10010975_35160 [Comamonas phosphati]|nr:hypothetical protein GCM10010975_35160 [Comamonas phosphati]